MPKAVKTVFQVWLGSTLMNQYFDYQMARQMIGDKSWYTLTQYQVGVLDGSTDDKELANAFDAGWEALRLEHEAQRADPSHPITRVNPWRSDGKDQQ